MKLRFPPRFKPNKAWIVLGVALGIGLLAALAARSYLNNQMEAIDARNRGQQVNVVVAKRELKRGDKLSSENVAVRAIPMDYAHSGAVSPGAFDRLDGQTLAFPVKAGEMVMWSLLEGKKVPTFSARVEAGHRALTVPVDEINSISGMLEPGDMIDLIVTVDQSGKRRVFPLLQSVQVMATGQRSADDPKSGEKRSYSTATLDATPEQAENVIVAREIGKITALLRNPQDKQTRGKNVDMTTLLGLKSGSSVFADGGRQVPVLYGGRSGKLPEEGLRLGESMHSAAPGSAPEARTVATMTNLQPIRDFMVNPPLATSSTSVNPSLSAVPAAAPAGIRQP
jgi:pilus assembly protein CpaB